MAPAQRAPDLDGLAERLGHRFADPGLLRRALVHRSWIAEHPGEVSNERLEFLGDAILGMVVADFVYRLEPPLDEGRLTNARKSLVNAYALAEVAASLDVGRELLLGKGEAAAGGRSKTSLLSDAMEAIIAAVYLDGGWGAAYDLVVRVLGPRLGQAVAGELGADHKTLLNELAVRRGLGSARYEVREEGPAHEKRFFADVVVGGEVLGSGEGPSKKSAEQLAARQAYARLLAVDGSPPAELTTRAAEPATTGDAGPAGDPAHDGHAAPAAG